jgi:hypothetical protein
MSQKGMSQRVEPRRPYQPGGRSTVEDNRPPPVRRQEPAMGIGYTSAYYWGLTPWRKAGRESRA